MALDPGREPEEVARRERLAEQGIRGDEAAHRGGSRRAQAARERDLVLHVDPPADLVGDRAAALADDGFEALDDPIRAVCRQLVRALALDGQVDLALAPAADLDVDAIRDPEGQAEAVIAGPEVRRRRGHFD